MRTPPAGSARRGGAVVSEEAVWCDARVACVRAAGARTSQWRAVQALQAKPSKTDWSNTDWFRPVISSAASSSHTCGIADRSAVATSTSHTVVKLW